MKWSSLAALLGVTLAVVGARAQPTTSPGAARLPADANDWAMYNYDVIGTRHNHAENRINAQNVTQLEEKWRFPAEESNLVVGVIHATPIVVSGYVYFGTATLPTFYKLTPDGKVKWFYRNPVTTGQIDWEKVQNQRSGINYISPTGGIFGSALVAGDSVYFGDIAGVVYCLDRATGKENWKVDTRSKEFPGGHVANSIFSSPIVADGKLIVAGGAYEHALAANPSYPCCFGRGYVLALDPGSGKLIWKYDVGPEPEQFDPPVLIEDSRGRHKFHYGPSTSSVWCTPSYDESTRTLFFGSDIHNSPRKPTSDNPRRYTRHSSALIALDVEDGAERWITQINPDDVWNHALQAYDPETGLYKDQSIGDTPKLYTIQVDGEATKVIGFGCKNGGFYVLDAEAGKILHHTPVYRGSPSLPLDPAPDPRTLALPSLMGGLQTGCATDGSSIFTNGIDFIQLGQAADSKPTGGRVVAISLDARREHWRHDRPLVASVGGPHPARVYRQVGDPVASGIAVAGGVVYFTTVASNKLMALDAATGQCCKELELGPVWSGPSVSRGRVYVGTGNVLFGRSNDETYFPKRYTGTLHSFGLPGEDAVDRLGHGQE